ncbi:MAG: hypothetical protein EXS52_00845 [Candidatus Staskawiczbacteria bacterium]|nr:hypothetical protein [Candidatus Staskawiczbacteria bacterium]
MDIKHSYISIIFSVLIVVIILVSAFLAYDKYLVRKDFPVEAKISCLPGSGVCFKEECDAEDSRCTSDGVFYFKMITKRAFVDVPFEECEEQNQCEAMYCNEDSIADHSDFEVCF